MGGCQYLLIQSLVSGICHCVFVIDVSYVCGHDSFVFSTEFSPSPEAFTVSEPTSMSLALSWTVPFSQVTPNSFSISYTVDKLTGTLPAMTSVSLSIAIGDADLDTTDNASFRYVLGGLTAYTKYTFNLSSVYGASTSSVVSTTGTTSEACKFSSYHARITSPRASISTQRPDSIVCSYTYNYREGALSCCFAF